MIKTISREEYSVLERNAHEFGDNESLSASITILKRQNREFDKLVKLRFQNNLELVVSFIIANSVIHYDAEVIQEKITRKRYYRHFNRPVTSDSVIAEFQRERGAFHIYDQSSEDIETPDCFIEIRRELVPYDSVIYDVCAEAHANQPTLSQRDNYYPVQHVCIPANSDNVIENVFFRSENT